MSVEISRRHTPLSGALLERLRAEGFAGATVVHGVGGFGANSVIHTAGLILLQPEFESDSGEAQDSQLLLFPS
jgi:PII-like signaling protein